MPLQNRVTPRGEIVAHPARGGFMGNRGGRMHDEAKRLGTRRWATRAWIICLLEFRGRHRKVMAPRRYTELFFLDEAVAIAAGHRPCAECRRQDFNRWRDAFRAGNGLAGPLRAGDMDRRLHAERLVPKTKEKVVWSVNVGELPDGAFVELDGVAYLVFGDALLPWSFEGYGAPRLRPLSGQVTVLTPRSSVATLGAGYRPEIAPSAAV
jgi:hypothetical protein